MILIMISVCMCCFMAIAIISFIIHRVMSLKNSSHDLAFMPGALLKVRVPGK